MKKTVTYLYYFGRYGQVNLTEHAFADEHRAVALCRYLNIRELLYHNEAQRQFRLHTVTVHESPPRIADNTIYTQFELETLNEKDAKGNKV